MARAGIDLCLAGIAFHVSFDAAEAPWVEARFGLYRCQPAPDAFRLEISHEPSRRIDQPAGIAFPGALGMRQGSVLRFTRRDEILTVDPAQRTAEALFGRPPGDSGSFADQMTSLDAPLRILLGLLLPGRSGLLVHAAGFGDDQRALVFPAMSGGGKTTTARKMAAPNVLSDDQVALVRAEGRWHAYALPFVGVLGRPTVPRRAPLAALAFLGKAGTLARRPLRPAAAASRLLGCVVRHAPGPADDVIDLAARLALEVSCFELDVAIETPFDELERALQA